MYRIERRPSGYLLTFGGLMVQDEMQRWVEESKQALAAESKPFSVVVDMRTLAPLAPGVQAVMIEGQQLYKQSGMVRSSVVLNNAVLAIQFKKLAKDSGIYDWERYFDGSRPDAIPKAVAWAKDGTDPDLN